MPLFLSTICVGVCLLVLPLSWGQGACSTVVRASVEVASGKYSLAELLDRSTCPALRQAAASIPLGRVPLAGSDRVMTGNEVRALLAKLAVSTGKSSQQFSDVHVPQRVIVRRAGPRGSCAEIAIQILSSSEIHSPLTKAGFAPAAKSSEAKSKSMTDAESARTSECGAGSRIPRGAPFLPTGTVWNSALATWDVSARCVHPVDCVPFLVRMPGQTPQLEKTIRNLSVAKVALAGKPLVRAGEAVTLLWDQGGIRLVVPAVCLDKGAAGEAVRARIVSGGRMVRAVVESAGRLRVAS